MFESSKGQIRADGTYGDVGTDFHQSLRQKKEKKNRGRKKQSGITRLLKFIPVIRSVLYSVLTSNSSTFFENFRSGLEFN